MSSLILFLVVLYFYFLASLLWCVLLAVIGGHLQLLSAVFLAQSCSWGCLLSCVLMFMFIPGISSSLFSLWFWLDSQSSMNRSGPGLYIILILYWWILSSMHCSLWDNVAMSFENCHQGFVVSFYTYISGKTVVILSGASSLQQFVPFLVCSGLAPSATPDTSVLKYGGFISL